MHVSQYTLSISRNKPILVRLKRSSLVGTEQPKVKDHQLAKREALLYNITFLEILLEETQQKHLDQRSKR